jgi:microsomal dipeptidase-like Zn-dependent dipeptidase
MGSRNSRDARWLALCASLVAAVPLISFVADGDAQPKVPPGKFPTVPVPPVPRNLMAKLFANPTFEDAAMVWKSAGPIAPKRECARRTVVQSANLKLPNGKPIASLGGNYWKVPFETASTKGEEGVCFLQSALGAALNSPPFRQTDRYLSMRVRARVAGATVRVVTASNEELEVKPVPVGDLMSRVTFDLSTVAAVHKAKQIQIIITPAGTKDVVEIDDVSIGSVMPGPIVASLTGSDVWGYVDTHAHPMANLAHGGKMIFGALDGDPAVALGACDPLSAHGVPGLNSRAVMDAMEVGRATNQHGSSGWPHFDDWPLFSTLLHQQMYVDWIRRAYEGGLRIMVAQIGTNEMFSRVFGNLAFTDEKSVVRMLVGKLQEFVSRHDFMEIARTPAEARSIIQRGKLAIVMGVEVDSLGNCRGPKTCTEAEIIAESAALYDLGIRHIFPIAHADNQIGGAALYDSSFNLLTWWLQGHYLEVDPNAPAMGVSWKLDMDMGWLKGIIGGINRRVGNSAVFSPPNHLYAQHPAINLRGLTPIGRNVIKDMLERGFLIDIDHMSRKSTDEVAIMAGNRGQGVISGHTGLRELQRGPDESDDKGRYPHEANKGPADIELLKSRGGFISPITIQGNAKQSAYASFPQDCDGSSKAWAHAYTYLVGKGLSVGVGTDMNGTASQPLPRFGTFACLGRKVGGAWGGADTKRIPAGRTHADMLRGDADAQTRAVTYKNDKLNKVRNYHAQRFWRSRTVLTPDEPYTEAERNSWEAIAIFKAGVDPKQAEREMAQYTPLQRTWVQSAIVVNLAIGLRATAPEADFAGNHYWAERTAGFLVRTNAALPANANPTLRERYRDLKVIWDAWNRMEVGGNASDPLQRYTMGKRDWDLNIDGLAHYGLMPDFFQDVANLLSGNTRGATDLRVLFHSAEDYIRLWEKVDANKGVR